uniref:NADH dehydrogenase subunit 6 n=1 Tax=Drawida japonica TaxID=408826 RepID=A0A0N6YS14_9ANNE|nr:NADH dehydrogenase subunit 6 [Drawida japonica]AIR76347.1 NADH dehydrogenase subunit 6 [Drawida japonica]
MILSLYIMLMTTISFSIYLSSTPISLGISILMMALLLSCTFASVMSSWFAFLIFLIYIGGMLVMFAYFLALTPNQHSIPMFNIPILIMSLLTLYFILFVTDMKMMSMSDFSDSFVFLYSQFNSPILILFVLILLLAMVIVVKLTYRSKGPLRPFF